jgi:calcineurin-like phosphoesterase family protein
MKITLNKGQKIFFTSDTHFHHKNICKGATEWELDRNYRPFQNLEQMDNRIVENINSTVGEDDILFHLGDWSFGGKEQIFEFRKQIKCKNIHLILGNHDHHIEGDKIVPQNETITFKELFSSVAHYRTLTVSIPQERTSKMVNQPKNKKFRFVLCHFPIASWKDMNQGVMHLHGHIHTPNKYKVGPGKMMDVGVDGNTEFKPYELNEILVLLKDQPIKGLLTHGFDHHG